MDILPLVWPVALVGLGANTLAPQNIKHNI